MRRRPGRSAASALGIGLATGLVVTLLAVSEGVQVSATQIASGSGVDLIVTSANTSLAAGGFPDLAGAHALPSGLRAADPNVETASPWLVTSFTYANRSLAEASNRSAVPVGWSPTTAGTIGWLPSEAEGLQLPTVLEGPGYPSPGDPHYANGSYDGPTTRALVLDEGLAAVLHVGPGDVVFVSAASPSGPSALPEWFAGATAFRVAGISNPYWLIPSALLAFGYLSEVQALRASGGPPRDGASLVLVHLYDPTLAASDQSRLERADPAISVFTLGDILTEIQHQVALYRTFGTLVGAIGLVVATLLTSTILLMGVDDRSRELALLRAIGHRRRTVALLVVEEGLLLAGLGLVVGLGLGYVGSIGLERALEGLLPNLPAGFSFVRFDASVIVASSLAVAAIGLVASLLPAARAMQLPIAEELRAP